MNKITGWFLLAQDNDPWNGFSPILCEWWSHEPTIVELLEAVAEELDMSFDPSAPGDSEHWKLVKTLRSGEVVTIDRVMFRLVNK